MEVYSNQGPEMIMAYAENIQRLKTNTTQTKKFYENRKLKRRHQHDRKENKIFAEQEEKEWGET